MATHAPSMGARTCAPTVSDADSFRYIAFPLNSVEIIGKINRACREHSITVSRFGRQAVGEPRLHSDLMGGRTLRPATQTKIEAFIASLGETRHGA